MTTAGGRGKRAGGCDHARVHVTVAASPVFFGWLAQFGTAVRLEAPSALARQYADYLRDIADSY
ncbi:MAG: hypothetical protein ACLSGS_01905 [Adlercreutzia sp.]